MEAQTKTKALHGALASTRDKKAMGNPLQVFIGISIALVIVVFIIVMGVVMTENLSGQVNDSAKAQQVATEGTQELEGLMGWVSIVILVMIMVVLIGAILLIANISG